MRAMIWGLYRVESTSDRTEQENESTDDESSVDTYHELF